jgi:prevent-host-death family protein
MGIKFSEDIRSVTDLKRNTRGILNHLHQTGRPVVLTVNGKADAVLMNAKSYELYLRAVNLARPVRAFLKEFKRERQIPS